MHLHLIGVLKFHYMQIALFPFDLRICTCTVFLQAKSPRPDLPLWMTEGADAQSSGSPNLSNRYVSGLLWMETLGTSAKLGKLKNLMNLPLQDKTTMSCDSLRFGENLCTPKNCSWTSIMQFGVDM